MAVGCGASCSKLLLIVFNLLFWLSGGALLAIGIWFRVDSSVFETLKLVSFDRNDPFLQYAIYILIGTGAFIFIVGFLGCCGAIRENKCMLGLYIFLLIIVMAAEVAIGVLAFLNKNKLRDQIEKDLVIKLRADPLASPSEKTGTIQFTLLAELMMYSQFAMQCCGVNGPLDYKGLNISALQIPVLPTCCKMQPSFKDKPENPDISKVANWDLCKNESIAALDGDTKNTSELHTQGCKEKLISVVEEKSIILIAIGLGIAFLEVIGVILSICLCCSIGKASESD